MIDWDNTSQAANASILSAFSVPVSFIIDGSVTKTEGVFSTPSDIVNSQSRRTDDYDLHGVDARRSDYELEMLVGNVPPAACEGTCVEVHNRIYSVTNIDPPEGSSVILHLIDTGGVV